MLLQCLHAVAQLKQEREEEQLRDRLSETNEDIRLLEREKERLEKENSKAKEAKERYQYLGIMVHKIYRRKAAKPILQTNKTVLFRTNNFF